MSHAYTEDQLVEQPAIGLFAELGWTTVSALEVGGNLRRDRHVVARDQGRCGVGVAVAGGAGAVLSVAAAGGHHRRRG